MSRLIVSSTDSRGAGDEDEERRVRDGGDAVPGDEEEEEGGDVDGADEGAGEDDAGEVEDVGEAWDAPMVGENDTGDDRGDEDAELVGDRNDGSLAVSSPASSPSLCC